MGIAIEVENLSKAYQLGQFNTGALAYDLKRWWALKRGKEDPFLKIGETNDRTTSGDSNIVWSLRDINFQIEQGEAIGIIGRNGAGKSTLLKLLSSITSPTTGEIRINGRIASLLEVGTGFHPELTGKENIYLNGAILGMRKQEIKRKFDEIVDFSGVERYIDTPVKRYSSGMYVRLAFAVAAHLESEILIVDEVLAVGDAEFQKKCLGKMNDVSKGEGRTVLFVSHNMGAINDLCDSALLLDQGALIKRGNPVNIINEYLQKVPTIDSTTLLNDYTTRRGHGEIRFSEITLNKGSHELDPTKEIDIYFRLEVNQEVTGGVYFYVGVKDPIYLSYITDSGYLQLFEDKLSKGSSPYYHFTIKPNTFRTGVFPLYFWLGKDIRVQDYPFDIVDSIYCLNLVSRADSLTLGYNSINPSGTFNIDCKISNVDN